MEREQLNAIVEKTNAILELERKIVGIKFLFTEEEFNKVDARTLTKPMPYCVMVKSAMAGFSIKMTLETSGCMGGLRALGFIDTTEEYKSGVEYKGFGLYCDLATAKNVVNNLTTCKQKIYGVLAQPLELYDSEPDVVIVVSNSYNAMRVIQGYTYIYGTQANFKMTGNQAICSECTAYPFESNSINISMLCSGTRYSGRWEQYEIGMGMPFNKFTQVVEGIYNTINAAESNKNKEKIKAKLDNCKCQTASIEKDQSYFLRIKNKD